eukprot:scaffold5897_cov141-Amphora_coffeaeformis.AAC.4
MTITDDPKSVKKVLKIIDCCIILHNLLVDVDTVPDRWLEDVDPQSDIDVPDEEITAAITDEHDKDERRQRLLMYFKDYVF